MVLQRQIWSTFVTVLWFGKTKFTDRTGILVLVRLLWDVISKIYWQLRQFLQKYTLKLLQFLSHWIMWRKMVRLVCLPSVSMATWHLHILWHFTVPAYSYHDESIISASNITKYRCGYCKLGVPLRAVLRLRCSYCIHDGRTTNSRSHRFLCKSTSF